MAMANVTTVTSNVITWTIGDHGSSGTDWRLGAASPDGIGCSGGILCRRIQFCATAANDIIRIQQSTDGLSSGGALLWRCLSSGQYDDNFLEFDPPMRIFPVIDVSSCTLGGTSGTGLVIFYLV